MGVGDSVSAHRVEKKCNVTGDAKINDSGGRHPQPGGETEWTLVN